MDILSKNKLLTALVILMFIMNLGLVVSFWFYNRPDAKDRPRKDKQEEVNLIDFIKKELDFNKIQSDSLEEMYHNYLKTSETMKEEIKKVHNRINDQVLKDLSPVNIKSDFETLGFKKGELDKVSYIFFLDLRKLCNPGQVSRFDELYNDIIRIIKKPQQKN